MKKRQRIRQGLIISSLLLFPVTMFYFSPYLFIWGASKGLVIASAFTFSAMFVGSLFVGRAFCGWIMPCAGLQESLFAVNGCKPKTGKLSYLKYVWWIPWLLAAAVLVLRVGGYRRVDYFFHLEHGISLYTLHSFIPYYIVLFLFVALSLVFGKRATCHYLCWMSPFMIVGRKISNLLTLPALRLKAVPDVCVGCGRCTKVCPMSLDVQAMVRSGRMEHSECILCGQCVDVCTKHAVSYRWGRPQITIPENMDIRSEQ